MKIVQVICGVLTLIAVHTCVRIEIYNYRMGGYLPRQEPGKWRFHSAEAERKMMEMRLRTQAESDGVPFVLTEEQKRQLDEAEAKARPKATLDNDFHDFVELWGLLQYLVAPLATLLGFGLLIERTATKRARKLGGLMFALALPCVILMFYRGYFSALGW